MDQGSRGQKFYLRTLTSLVESFVCGTIVVFVDGMPFLSVPIAIYRLIALPSSLISVITAITVWSSHDMAFLSWAIWTKVCTTGLLLLFIHLLRPSYFHYFHNLGYATHAIYLWMAGVDLALYALLLSIAVWLQ